jgi:type IV pilus assembly protein PilW
MAHMHPTSRQPRARFQRGLTLIEFMVSITLGMLIVAAVATLIADQSATRAEVDRSGRMIENGRYAIRTLADDAQLAGYWGELNGVPTDAVLAALPDPCLTGLADVQAASQLHIQAYNAPAPAAVPTCVSNQLTGTDILVVRHVDPDTSALTTGGVPDLTKLTAGQYYVQTGLNAAGTAFTSALNIASATAATNTANFSLVKKDKLTTANVRKMVVRIYYVAQCSVENAGSCAGADNGNPIPTLKMIELSAAAGAVAWSSPVAIAEGIEQLQIDYGVDTNDDGAPDSDNVSGGALTHLDTGNVMALKIHVVARALEKSAGFTDDKKYPLGTHGDYVPASADQAYKRHAFVQSVRLVNPSTRRQP